MKQSLENNDANHVISFYDASSRAGRIGITSIPIFQEDSAASSALFDMGLTQAFQGLKRIIGVFNYKTLLGPVSDIKAILASELPALKKLSEVFNTLTSFPESFPENIKQIR